MHCLESLKKLNEEAAARQEWTHIVKRAVDIVAVTEKPATAYVVVGGKMLKICISSV